MAAAARPAELQRTERATLPEVLSRRLLPIVRSDVIESDGERVEPRVRGEKLLAKIDSLFQRLDAFIENHVSSELNPFAQTGAIANTSFLVAVVSGILLLFWWKASVYQSFDSVRAMGAQRFGGGLVRSLHRYSSDACMLFVLVHATKLFFARRFGGARWLAWVTGIVLVGFLWLIGWLGYWLVWDERGELVALGSARLLDALPIFADPLSRSFLVDERLNSLLFFVVFFLHMLLPLAMGIALWIHIKRLSRPRFLTRRWMTVWVVASLVLVSLIFPADHAQVAKMAQSPTAFSLDAFYLLPIHLTERLGSGALWAVVLLGGSVIFSVPWVLARGRARVAMVNPARCNACEKCYLDCPYEAIQMVPRSDGKPFATLAQVDPDKCLGCGICAGSCDSAGIELPWFGTIHQRHRLDRLLEHACKTGPAPIVAFVCNESAAQSLSIDPDTGRCAKLDGYLAIRVPCAGWVHALTIERALRRGAAGVLIVACGPSGGMYREGGEWTRQRLLGEREPKLRTEKIDRNRVELVELFRPEQQKLVDAARAFRERLTPERKSKQSFARRVGFGSAIAATVAVALWGISRVAFAAPGSDGPVLVLSFKHAGKATESCREPSAAELAKLPKHMRPKQICERRRASVRLRVAIDDLPALDRSYEPRGIWHDGSSIAIERLPLTPGTHVVRVELIDTPEPSAPPQVSERRIAPRERQRVVVLFDEVQGFKWYE